MLQQIVGRSKRTDRYTGRQSTTFHVEQGFGYGFDSNGEYEVQIFSTKLVIRKSVFTTTDHKRGKCSVTKCDAEDPSRASTFDVRSNLSTYTVSPKFIPSTKYVVTKSASGYRLAKFISGADTSPYDEDPTGDLDAFDVAIFMDNLEAEESFDVIPERPFRPSIPPPRALPRGVEARIEARRRANGIPLDDEFEESHCLISLN